MSYRKLRAMVTGFLDCALWAGTDGDGDPLDARFGWDNLAPDTVHAACNDCAEFLALCEAKGVADFEALILRHSGDPDSSAGLDFLLTRDGHGAGFWDGDWSQDDSAADLLTDAAQTFGEFFLYIGDDGMIYNG